MMALITSTGAFSFDCSLKINLSIHWVSHCTVWTLCSSADAIYVAISLSAYRILYPKFVAVLHYLSSPLGILTSLCTYTNIAIHHGVGGSAKSALTAFMTGVMIALKSLAVSRLSLKSALQVGQLPEPSSSQVIAQL